MEIAPTFADGQLQITHEKKHVGFIERGQRGVTAVLLSKLNVPLHREAVRAAEVFLRRDTETLVVSIPGTAAWLAAEGFAVDERPRFQPRFFEAARARLSRLPCANWHVHRHDGVSWRRKRPQGWSRPMRGVWHPLGLLVEVKPLNREVRVAPLPGKKLLVSGAVVTSWCTMAPHDVIKTEDAEFVYLPEPAGREQRAEWWMQTGLGGGWADPSYTRGHRRFTTPADGLPCA